MLSISEALGILKKHVPPALAEEVAVDKALGRVLAEDIPAPEPAPRFTNSAMDGFAINRDDLDDEKGDHEDSLLIVGESRAGKPFEGKIRPGQAVRISTGAMMPDGADTVVRIEDTSEDEGRVLIRSLPKKGQHVRLQGEDIQEGQLMLRKNTRLGPASLGMLATMGIENVSVYRRPETALVVTGSEFAPSKKDIKPWQIRDSNTVMLSSAVTRSGGRLVLTSRAGDSLSEIRSAIAGALGETRIIIVSGGVSVGPHDLVKPAAEQMGFETLFWQVNQKPGKPLFLAKKSGVLLFGLPGNPVSALNCYAFYVHPVLRRMQSMSFKWNTVNAVLGGSCRNDDKRSLFLRCRLDRENDRTPRAFPFDKQGSHMLSSMVDADGFILLGPGESIEEGRSVDVYLYPWSET